MLGLMISFRYARTMTSIPMDTPIIARTPWSVAQSGHPKPFARNKPASVLSIHTRATKHSAARVLQPNFSEFDMSCAEFTDIPFGDSRRNVIEGRVATPGKATDHRGGADQLSGGPGEDLIHGGGADHVLSGGSRPRSMRSSPRKAMAKQYPHLGFAIDRRWLPQSIGLQRLRNARKSCSLYPRPSSSSAVPCEPKNA
jgi:hypothetical protein